MVESVNATGAVDAAEIAKFAAMADDWWDPQGSAKPLHWMNPCRLGYIRDQIAAETGRDPRRLRCLDGLDVLDIGCGGGLICEPLARMGARVTGIDAAAESIGVARHHCAEAGLEIDYRVSTAEALGADAARFDAVLAMEVIEHVPDADAFVRAAAALLKPGGVFVASTLNRTPQSYAMAIVGAERILRWLPRGTHDWRRFVPPETFAGLLEGAGLSPVDRRGICLDPVAGDWRLSPTDLSVNYLITAIRPA